MAGAPITWGVCEVPGWGHQMGRDRVLREMAELGLTATEAGPDGFLPGRPEETRRVLGPHGLSLVAGFVPVTLHRPEIWSRQRASATGRIAFLAEAGAEVAVIAATTGVEGYESTARLDPAAWNHLLGALSELTAAAEAAGVLLTVHPHYGTVIETGEQIDRFLAASDLPICLDTGHLLVGGTDPVDLARRARSRVRHVHLKDVDTRLAARVREGDLGYRAAVACGLYRPLGQGDLEVDALLSTLRDAGFEGWLVLEQDTVIEGEPPSGGGPRTAAEVSLRRLERMTGSIGISVAQSTSRGGRNET